MNKYNILITAEIETDARTPMSAENKILKQLKQIGITKVRIIETS